MPSLFKERLFVWLSRFCPTRYCVVRHVGFLLGDEHGHASGDADAPRQSIEDVVRLLQQASPWEREMASVYEHLEELTEAPASPWPVADSEREDAIFACGAIMFAEPARGERARRALVRALGARGFEYFSALLAFIRTAHYWTMLHPEIETEEDMRSIMRGHEELSRLLLEDPEAARCEMGERLFEELTTLRELHERQELVLAKQALEERDRQKDMFIAILAHELRNPLGAISAATDAMALLRLQDPRAVQLVERLDRQTTAIARMLDDLLDASRIALGQVSVRLERVRLQDMLTDTLAEHEVRAQTAGLRLLSQFTTHPCDVAADRVRLRQVVDNLLSNAIKFTPQGGVVELALLYDEADAVITVRDSGIGFDDQFAGHLFEPFTQHEQARDRARGGLGLGLSIASRLARLQGGSLSATSDGLGKGALFTLRLPIAERSNESSRQDAIAPRGSQTILLVEDNRDMADSLADLLELSGFSVRVARDGPAALRAALDHVPELILCDLGLPGAMDGFAVARACRAEETLRSVRLVALSGYNAPEDHAAAFESGFECLFTKPLTRESLQLITHGVCA